MPPGGDDDEVGGEYAVLVGSSGADRTDADDASPLGAEGQPLDPYPVGEGDGGQGQHAPADGGVQQGAAEGLEGDARRDARGPARGVQHREAPEVGQRGAARGEFGAQAGEEPLQDVRAARQQRVGVAALRGSSAVDGPGVDPVRLDHGHGVEAAGEDPGRDEPRVPSPHDHGMPLPPPRT